MKAAGEDVTGDRAITDSVSNSFRSNTMWRDVKVFFFTALLAGFAFGLMILAALVPTIPFVIVGLLIYYLFF